MLVNKTSPTADGTADNSNMDLKEFYVDNNGKIISHQMYSIDMKVLWMRMATFCTNLVYIQKFYPENICSLIEIQAYNTYGSGEIFRCF